MVSLRKGTTKPSSSRRPRLEAHCVEEEALERHRSATAEAAMRAASCPHGIEEEPPSAGASSPVQAAAARSAQEKLSTAAARMAVHALVAMRTAAAPPGKLSWDAPPL